MISSHLLACFPGRRRGPTRLTTRWPWHTSVRHGSSGASSWSVFSASLSWSPEGNSCCQSCLCPSREGRVCRYGHEMLTILQLWQNCLAPSEHRTVVARNEVKQLQCGSQTPLSRTDSVALCERSCFSDIERCSDLTWLKNRRINTDDVYFAFHCLVLNNIDIYLIPLSVDTPSLPKKENISQKTHNSLF